jgi:hypothetical protein
LLYFLFFSGVDLGEKKKLDATLAQAHTTYGTFALSNPKLNQKGERGIIRI